LFTYSAIRPGIALWRWRKLGGLKNRCIHDIILSLAEYGMDVNISFVDQGNPLYRAIYPPFSDENDDAFKSSDEAKNAINRAVIIALVKSGAMLPSDDWFENNKDKYNTHSIDALIGLIEEYDGDVYSFVPTKNEYGDEELKSKKMDTSINDYFKKDVNDRKIQAKTNFLALKSHLKKLQPPLLAQEHEKGVELIELKTMSNTNPESDNKPIPKVGPYNRGGTKRMRRKIRSTKSKRKTRKHKQSKKTKTKKRKQKTKRNRRTRKKK